MCYIARKEIRIDSWISNHSKTHVYSKFFVMQIDYFLGIFPVHWYFLLIVDPLGKSDWDSIQLPFLFDDFRLYSCCWYRWIPAKSSSTASLMCSDRLWRNMDWTGFCTTCRISLTSHLWVILLTRGGITLRASVILVPNTLNRNVKSMEIMFVKFVHEKTKWVIKIQSEHKENKNKTQHNTEN